MGKIGTVLTGLFAAVLYTKQDSLLYFPGKFVFGQFVPESQVTNILINILSFLFEQKLELHRGDLLLIHVGIVRLRRTTFHLSRT